MTIIYLAYPIDRVPDSQQRHLHLDVLEVRNALSALPNTLVYDPGKPWFGEDKPLTPVVQQVNHAALDAADLVFALFPGWSTSVGVPMEIKRAADAGKVVIVYRDHLSYALMELTEGGRVYVFDSLLKAINSVAGFGHLIQPALPSQAKVIVQASEEALRFTNCLTRAYPDDAGFDLAYSGPDPMAIMPNQVRNVPCGVRVQWPPNVWAMLVGRSSTFRDRELLVNITVIDPGYRGEMFCLVRNVGEAVCWVKAGERLAQLIPMPALAPGIEPTFGQVDAGTRGENGFGSSGR